MILYLICRAMRNWTLSSFTCHVKMDEKQLTQVRCLCEGTNCPIGHNTNVSITATANSPFGFHINKDKVRETYCGPNPPPHPHLHPSRQINWATWQEIKYLLQADLHKADWTRLYVPASQSPRRGLVKVKALQLRHRALTDLSTTWVI
jgi:hypothetical protein